MPQDLKLLQLLLKLGQQGWRLVRASGSLLILSDRSFLSWGALAFASPPCVELIGTGSPPHGGRRSMLFLGTRSEETDREQPFGGRQALRNRIQKGD